MTQTSPATRHSGLDDAPGWADPDELDRFEVAVARFVAGEYDPEDFRRLRIWHGVYGQRDTDAHMIRVKVPGGALSADALDALADVGERYGRGWGHITTRQNVELHSVALPDVVPALRRLASGGLTGRESGGDTVRNVTACSLAGVCRSEVFDVTAAAEALARHFLRNPLAQSLARKFKIAVSGCAADCALAAIQDVGVVAAEHEGRQGFQLLIGGGLGTDPRLAEPLEPLTDPRDLLVTVEALLRVWDRENVDRTRRVHVRVRNLVQRLGLEAVRELVFAERARLRCSATYRDEPPEAMLPARRPHPSPVPPTPHDADAPDDAAEAAQLTSWVARCVLPQKDDGRFAVHATARLGDVTTAQWRTLSAAARELGVVWRTTIRQNLVAHDVAERDLPRLHRLLTAAGLGACGDRAAASVVSCPGTETCNRALTASRGVATATVEALFAAGLAQAPVTINVSGCPNSCAQQQLADIGLSGLIRRVGAVEAPGYRILLGGGSNADGATLGRYVAKGLARQVPDVVVAIVRRYLDQRHDGEPFRAWVERTGTTGLGTWLAAIDGARDAAVAPELLTDWGSDDPFRIALGRSECGA